jgi:ABC-type transport system involved in cytochrome c biogenesis permease component
VRWLLLKDLRILRRSPVMVSLLVIYPIVIAVLIGFALSRAPDKPKVALYNGLSVSASTIELGGRRLNLADEEGSLFKDIEVVKARDREDVIRKVKNGDVLAGIVIPKDIAANIQSTLKSGRLQVFYNTEDPAKQAFVENTIDAQVKAANASLTRAIAAEALKLLNLIGKGGVYHFLGQDFNVLGLQRSQQVLDATRAALPPRSPQLKDLDEVRDFVSLARDNLSFSDDVLNVVGEPIKVSATSLKGGRTSLDDFAVALATSVSLMFITLLLAAGMLAIEREENAFSRLVRGLVSRTELLVEKAGLAAVCSTAVCLLMLAGLGLFVHLQWSRFGLWVIAMAVGALAFAALGLAIGALTREVRAASLLAFMLSLPIAFLALVPSGSVSSGLFDVIKVVSALFPFKPTLNAIDAALNDSGDLLVPLLHLLALTVGFGAIARLALRRFA